MQAVSCVEARQLDYIKVKGKIEPVAVLELQGEKGAVGKSMRVLSGKFEKALQPYIMGEWNSAIKRFSELKKQFPQDKACQVFLDRCRTLRKNPPIAWEGVYIFDKK